MDAIRVLTRRQMLAMLELCEEHDSLAAQIINQDHDGTTTIRVHNTYYDIKTNGQRERIAR
jgi:hypothetical protein